MGRLRNSGFTITGAIIPVFAGQQSSNSCNSEPLYYWRYYSHQCVPGRTALDISRAWAPVWAREEGIRHAEEALTAAERDWAEDVADYEMWRESMRRQHPAIMEQAEYIASFLCKATEQGAVERRRRGSIDAWWQPGESSDMDKCRALPPQIWYYRPPSPARRQTK